MYLSDLCREVRESQGIQIEMINLIQLSKIQLNFCHHHRLPLHEFKKVTLCNGSNSASTHLKRINMLKYTSTYISSTDHVAHWPKLMAQVNADDNLFHLYQVVLRPRRIIHMKVRMRSVHLNPVNLVSISTAHSTLQRTRPKWLNGLPRTVPFLSALMQLWCRWGNKQLFDLVTGNKLIYRLK